MQKPDSVAALTELGRVRLSEHFFAREMLYSEVANFHGMPNLPDDPETFIAAGRQLCEQLLEPLHAAFGHVTVRSAFRSVAVNGFCHGKLREGERAYFCGDNEYSRARHIWDRRDAEGFMGATASVVIPWYLPRFEETGDPKPLAWWIKDHVPGYAEMGFYPWLCAFNIRWYEGPASKEVTLSDGWKSTRLTNREMANFDEDHSELYAGFPVPGS
jgi:hypothetical protein